MKVMIVKEMMKLDSFLYNSKQIIEHNYNHLKNFDVENFENKFKNHFYKLNHQNIKTLL